MLINDNREWFSSLFRSYYLYIQLIFSVYCTPNIKLQQAQKMKSSYIYMLIVYNANYTCLVTQVVCNRQNCTVSERNFSRKVYSCNPTSKSPTRGGCIVVWLFPNCDEKSMFRTVECFKLDKCFILNQNCYWLKLMLLSLCTIYSHLCH